jgi:hypothetical protein
MTRAHVLDVSPDEYHKLPGFSASLAKKLIARSPSHAWDAFQRNTEEEEEEVTDEQRDRLERGTILHALVLGKGKRIRVLPYDKYSTKAARDARDEARAAGLVPVKEAKMEIFERVAVAIRSRIAAAGHTLDGTSEMAIEWDESTPHGPVQCRAMLDHVVTWALLEASQAPGAIIYDLKIVDDAHPDLNERTAERMGYAIQAAAYTRALAALHPRLAGRIEFRFLFCEPRRPYEIWDPTPDGMFRELGAQRWIRAVHAWGRGLEENLWPGYRTPERKEIAAPMWVLKREGFTADE